jgi:predicted dehydrogenase
VATSDVGVVAVADPLEDSHRRAQEMLGLSGADCYRDHRAVLDRGDIDFVDISTPHHTHREILEAAAETELRRCVTSRWRCRWPRPTR